MRNVIDRQFHPAIAPDREALEIYQEGSSEKKGQTFPFAVETHGFTHSFPCLG